MLGALAVRESSGTGVTLAMRLRHGPDAVGRPEEVVAALGAPPAPRVDVQLEIIEIVRERVVLADEPDAPPPGRSAA
jgi:hypothetical protein